MEKIIALCDYKNRYGAKDREVPYRSGMDKDLLHKLFEAQGYDLTFRQFADIQNEIESLAGQLVLYTSQEDIEYKYKDYIEDIVFSIQLAGGIEIPQFKYLRSNNNKVFMELLRKTELSPEYQLKTNVYGCFEEAMDRSKPDSTKYIIKSAKGAGGHGVYLSTDAKTFSKYVRMVSDTSHLKEDIKDYLRPYKHEGYIRESRNRERFIVQEFIPNLHNDWKVYVFGEHVYVFFRPILKHRVFKASGGGHHNYSYGLKAQIPDGLLDYAAELAKELNVPHASFDIAWDGSKFYLLEFQCLYFGTGGVTRSEHYFEQVNGEWTAVANTGSIEAVYVNSIVWYIDKVIKAGKQG